MIWKVPRCEACEGSERPLRHRGFYDRARVPYKPILFVREKDIILYNNTLRALSGLVTADHTVFQQVLSVESSCNHRVSARCVGGRSLELCSERYCKELNYSLHGRQSLDVT